jgi:hypothetical protein
MLRTWHVGVNIRGEYVNNGSTFPWMPMSALKVGVPTPPPPASDERFVPAPPPAEVSRLERPLAVKGLLLPVLLPPEPILLAPVAIRPREPARTFPRMPCRSGPLGVSRVGVTARWYCGGLLLLPLPPESCPWLSGILDDLFYGAQDPASANYSMKTENSFKRRHDDFGFAHGLAWVL